MVRVTRITTDAEAAQAGIAPDGHRLCPIHNEGAGEWLPESEFYRVAAKGYTGGVRYRECCKACWSKRVAAYQAERIKRDPEFRLRRRQSKREWIRHNRKPARERNEITLREAGELLGVSRTTVQNWQRDGDLPTPLTRESIDQFQRLERPKTAK